MNIVVSATARLASRMAPATAMTVLLAVAACAPRQQGPAPTPPPPAPVETPQPPKTVEPQRIAVLVPLSGANAPVGVSLANAATLALVDTGRQGIRLTSYDTAALGAGAAARRALDDGAQLILGPLLAQDVAAVRAVAEPRGVTMLSFSNDSAVASGRLYVLGYQPQQSVTRVVEYAAGRGVTRFAGLIPNGIYGQRTSVAFTRAVAANKGQLLTLANFARDAKALPAAARQVIGGDPRTPPSAPPFEALLIADSGTVAASFGPHLAKAGAPAGSFLLMGTELWNTESGLPKVASLHGAVFASVPDQQFNAMAQRYRARFGGTPSRLASLAYDATLLAVSAAQGQWQPGQPFPAQILSDSKGFAGVDGIFRFRGNVAERGLEVQQVGAQGFVTVSPAPAAF